MRRIATLSFDCWCEFDRSSGVGAQGRIDLAALPDPQCSPAQ